MNLGVWLTQTLALEVQKVKLYCRQEKVTGQPPHTPWSWWDLNMLFMWETQQFLGLPGLHHQLIYSKLLAETIEQWLETVAEWMGVLMTVERQSIFILRGTWVSFPLCFLGLRASRRLRGVFATSYTFIIISKKNCYLLKKNASHSKWQIILQKVVGY